MEIQNFIKTIMENDLKEKKVNEIITRFPPEPNAYLHIGHARAIVINFELAKHFKGKTNLRFDDTNPVKEDKKYVDGIIEDVRWLGYEPDNILYGSDYFEETFNRAVILIKKGLAYVCDLSGEEVSKYRGNLTTVGTNSPYRNRTVEENLKLFLDMRNGVYKDGEKTLRAKIDMSHPNMNMRDPAMYRIIHTHHHRQGDAWCIYPMYDFAHPLQDSIENISHSLCSLEFDNHRILYDWFIENCDMENISRQYEFGRLGIDNTITSKRYLKQLVDMKLVKGYDDPVMPTLRGLRRKGYTKESIKEFILSTGLSRVNSSTSIESLNHFLREDLKLKVNRVNAILDPLKVVITNYEEGKVEYLDALNNSENEELGSRKIAFSKYLYIEREDFLEEKPNKKWKRFSKDIEVRLMNAYFIKCNNVIKDKNGNIIELHCTYDESTKSGSGFNERKPNGNIHYVCATTAKAAEFRLYEPLLKDETEETKDLTFTQRVNENAVNILNGFVEEYLNDTKELDRYQFVRNGYYATDKDSSKDKLVFNRISGLKQSFSL